jgi:hypothetical protein
LYSGKNWHTNLGIFFNFVKNFSFEVEISMLGLEIRSKLILERLREKLFKWLKPRKE